MRFINGVIKNGIHLLGIELMKETSFKKLISFQGKVIRENADLKFSLNRMSALIEATNSASQSEFSFEGFMHFLTKKVLASKSQVFQDLFVLYCLKEKTNGFFVEFGATDGVGLSNTFLLETEYNWRGILAEPGKIWEAGLKQNRNCFIDNRCIWSRSGETVIFNETANPELSTIDSFARGDFFSEERKNCKPYAVETLSLNDLLGFYNAPESIDYLSIDTEGSEYEILNSFNFSKYSIRIITVEHNFSPKRDDIFKLLVRNGYKRVFETISMFDDWYIREPFETDPIIN